MPSTVSTNQPEPRQLRLEYDPNTAVSIKILEIQWMLIVHCQRGISGLLIHVSD